MITNTFLMFLLCRFVLKISKYPSNLSQVPPGVLCTPVEKRCSISCLYKVLRDSEGYLGIVYAICGLNILACPLINHSNEKLTISAQDLYTVDQ